MNPNNPAIKAVKLYDKFWSLEEANVRSFLIEGDDRALLVDTGWDAGNVAPLARSLTDKPIFVVITHADGDHVADNAAFGEVYMHPAEFATYRADKADQKDVRLLPLWEGDVIDLGCRRFEVLHMPGHTPGSILLLDRENRLLIGGDSLQPGPIWMFGTRRNMDAYLAGLKRLLPMADAFDTILPSHGDIHVTSDIIPDLIAAAEAMIAGEVKGTVPPAGMNCLLYTHGRIQFYA